MKAGAARLAVVGALVAGLAGAAVAQQASDRPFVDLRDSQCWTCHSNWNNQPLRDIVRVIAPESVGAAVGESFEYNVRFQTAWTPQPVWPELRFVNPAIDITQAPSLRFDLGQDDIPPTQVRGTIVVNPLTPNAPAMNQTTIAIPAGATSLSWTLTPDDQGATGPDLTLLITPPGGNGTRTVHENGRGEAESYNYTLEALQGMVAAGNWTIGARVRPLDSPSNMTVPQLRNVGFTITYSAEFDTAFLKVLGYPADRVVPGGSSFLQKWDLRFVQDPAPGEKVVISIASTPYYKHKTYPEPYNSDNVVDVPLEVEVRPGSPPVLYSPAPDTRLPSPANGPTVAQVSEILGYVSAFLLVASILSGGMFGQASRRWLNHAFHAAKRRVAYHNFLSYGLTVMAIVHMVIFLVPMVPGGPCTGVAGEWCIRTGDDAGIHRMTEDFQGTTGLLWFGGPALLAMFGLGVTGALQIPMIRRWSYPTWKWWHYGLTVATIVLTAMHMLIDGQNFGSWVDKDLRDTLADPFFQDPLAGVPTV